MTHILRTIVLSAGLAACMMMLGCTSSPSQAPDTERDVSLEVGNVCDQFCQSQGGPNYLLLFATSQAQCNSKGGDWYTADQDYEGPPPGCCCSCRRPGFCL